jgi:hypothetical protein
VHGVWRYVRYLSLADSKLIPFANQQRTLAAKENKHFLVFFRAVLATALAGLQVNSARAHSASLRLAIQEPLVFGILFQVYNEYACWLSHLISSKLGVMVCMGVFKVLVNLCQSFSLPFAMMSWAREWSVGKTSLTAVLCGVGHVLSSVVLGLAVRKLEFVESFRGNFAAWLLAAFGLAYLVWGLRLACSVLLTPSQGQLYISAAWLSRSWACECTIHSGQFLVPPVVVAGSTG